MADIEHEGSAESQGSTVKDEVQRAAEVVRHARAKAKRAKALFKEAEHEYERFLYDRFQGSKALVSGRLTLEQYQDQDGPSWCPAHGFLPETEVMIDDVFTDETEQYGADGKYDPLLYMSIVGEGNRGVAMFLSATESFTFIEDGSSQSDLSPAGAAVLRAAQR